MSRSNAGRGSFCPGRGGITPEFKRLRVAKVALTDVLCFD